MRYILERILRSEAPLAKFLMSDLSRRAFFESAALLGVSSTLFPGILYAQSQKAEPISIEDIEAAEKLAGLSFSPQERELMLEGLRGNLDRFESIRSLKLENSTIPSVVFDPQIGGKKAPVLEGKTAIEWLPESLDRPTTDEDLAFLTVPELSSLLKNRKVTSVELTELYLDRLRKYDPVLECVVTLTEERARRQARAADAEMDSGNWRGPLHGVPWGAKDLLSVSGYPTTWGAMPYKDQVLDTDAEVVQRLDDAGAVLIAKLTLGALAMGDVWFGGKTKNPWNLERGSSGSSAGPGSAVAGGLVGFAIGSETLGSIVSPSTRNGVTGLRPTFGRVSRNGAMTLSWTMDKLGPMCRSAEGCALVFSAIHGHDPTEPTTLTTEFSWPSNRSEMDLRVGVLSEGFESEEDRAVLDVLRDAGIRFRDVSFPEMDTSGMLLMLSVEAAAAFDDLTRSNRDDLLVRQDRGAWPNSFRKAQMIPAVEYVNASRARTVLMKEMHEMFEHIDVLVTPTFGNAGLRITNLTGHPCVTMPHHFAELEDAPESDRRNPSSITIIGGLYRDEAVLSLAALYQSRTEFHRLRPPIS